MPGFVMRLSRLLLDLPMRRKLLVAILATVSLPLLGLAAFSVAYYLESSARAARSSLHDKLDIGLLLMENAAGELLAVDRRVAGDNSLIINLELGLTESASQYLEDIALSQGVDFALVLAPDGTRLAGSPPPAGEAELVLPTGQAALAAAAGEGGRWFWCPPGDTLAALVPVHAGDGGLLGYAALAWHVHGDQEAGKALMRRMAAKTEAELLLGSAGGQISSTPALSGLALHVEGLLRELPTPESRAELAFGLRGEWRGMAAALRDHAGKPIALLGVALPSSTLEAGRWLTLGVIFLVFVLAFLLSLAAARWFAGTIARPVAVIAAATQEIIKGNFELDLKPEGRDEIGLMTEDFAVMSVQLRRLVSDLEREIAEHRAAEIEIRSLNAGLERRVDERTAALNQSVELLRSTQAELVQSEKMAALSHLVVGIAHELNTPLGNSLTASSYLEQQVALLEQEYAGGGLTRSHFTEAVKVIRESAALNQASLRRASRLVGFFKEMAVNMESEAPVPILLGGLVDEVLRGLSILRAAGLPRLENRVPAGLTLVTRAGTLARVLSNILENAADHAFDGQALGSVVITAQALDGWVEMQVCDDGAGIAEAERKKVFDPFYTTKRGAGHVGLGLSISFNLVVHLLGGSILCQAGPAGGACFVIRLPAVPAG